LLYLNVTKRTRKGLSASAKKGLAPPVGAALLEGLHIWYPIEVICQVSKQNILIRIYQQFLSEAQLIIRYPL